MVPSTPIRRRWASVLGLLTITYTSSSFQLRPNQNHKQLIIPGRSNAGVQLYSSPNAANESSDTSIGSSSRRRNRRKPRLPERNLYEILGASPAMSRTEIKRQYITLAKETHPDATNTSPEGMEDTGRFNEIAQAWTILSDTQTRRAYDRELAAQDFKDDVVKRAGEVAREYGPTARKFYDDFAIPFLKRTTATTVASWNAVTEVTSEVASERESNVDRNNNNNRQQQRNGNKLSGATLSEVVKEASEMQRTNSGGATGDALEDFGRAFQRVIQAGRNATRQIDGMELQEKSMELRTRADETRAQSMQVLEKLTEIKSERLRLTFRTSSANFSSDDAMQFLDGFTKQDDVTLMQKMRLKHPISKNVEAFTVAESEFDQRMQHKSEVDKEMLRRQRAFVQAENNAMAALEAEERARKMLEDAQRQVAESQKMVAETQRSIRDLDTTVKRADQDLSKADTMLKRKQDVVRRELKRKAETVEGTTFDKAENGKVRLNPGYDRSSSTMNAMGFETHSIETIEGLRKDERRTEGEFLRLVETASRLVSRSEKLRLKSEELIGKQQEQQQIVKDAETISQSDTVTYRTNIN